MPTEKDQKCKSNTSSQRNPGRRLPIIFRKTFVPTVKERGASEAVGMGLVASRTGWDFRIRILKGSASTCDYRKQQVKSHAQEPYWDE